MGAPTPIDRPGVPTRPWRSRFDPFRPLHGSFVLLVLAGFVVGLAVQVGGVRWLGWDREIGLVGYWLVLVSALLVPAWSWILGDPAGLRAELEGRRPQGRRSGIAFATVVAMVDLLVVAAVLARAKQLPGLPEGLVVAVCVVGVGLGWLLIHTAHAVHYFWLHYDQGKTLRFPGTAEHKPDLLDFLYFACAVGTTFGTTDVQVESSSIRRAVLRHGVLSFVVNTVILAMVVSYLGSHLVP